MFEAFVEECVEMTDTELDDAIRTAELEARSLAARQAGLIAVADARGLYRIDDHRGMRGYLRATCNTGERTIDRQRKLARLLDVHPPIGDALLAGHISVDHALELGRFRPTRGSVTCSPRYCHRCSTTPNSRRWPSSAP